MAATPGTQPEGLKNDSKDDSKLEAKFEEIFSDEFLEALRQAEDQIYSIKLDLVEQNSQLDDQALVEFFEASQNWTARDFEWLAKSNNSLDSKALEDFRISTVVRKVYKEWCLAAVPEADDDMPKCRYVEFQNDTSYFKTFLASFWQFDDDDHELPAGYNSERYFPSWGRIGSEVFIIYCNYNRRFREYEIDDLRKYFGSKETWSPIKTTQAAVIQHSLLAGTLLFYCAFRFSYCTKYESSQTKKRLIFLLKKSFPRFIEHCTDVHIWFLLGVQFVEQRARTFLHRVQNLLSSSLDMEAFPEELRIYAVTDKNGRVSFDFENEAFWESLKAETNFKGAFETWVDNNREAWCRKAYEQQTQNLRISVTYFKPLEYLSKLPSEWEQNFIEKFKNSVESVEEQLDTVKTELEQLKRDRLTAQESYESYRTQLKLAKQTLEHTKFTIATLTDNQEELQKQYKAEQKIHTEQLKTYERQQAELEAQLTKLKDELANKQNELANKQNELTAVQLEIETKQTQLAEYDAEVVATANELIDKQAQLNEANQEIDQIERLQKFDELKSENLRLENRLEETRKSLQKLAFRAASQYATLMQDVPTFEEAIKALHIEPSSKLSYHFNKLKAKIKNKSPPQNIFNQANQLYSNREVEKPRSNSKRRPEVQRRPEPQNNNWDYSNNPYNDTRDHAQAQNQRIDQQRERHYSPPYQPKPKNQRPRNQVERFQRDSERNRRSFSVFSDTTIDLNYPEDN